MARRAAVDNRQLALPSGLWNNIGDPNRIKPGRVQE
jgi:hypothetical protein